MQSTQDIEAQVAERRKILAEIRQDIGKANEKFRSMGYDPDKLRAMLSPADIEEAKRLVAQDWEDAKREVEQAMASMGPAPSRQKLGRKLGRLI